MRLMRLQVLRKWQWKGEGQRMCLIEQEGLLGVEVQFPMS